MTEATRKTAMVRPGFLKWSMVVFVLLLPFVVHSIWNYSEERTLAATIKDIAARGEPTALPEVHPEGGAEEAERDYRAAGVLASGFHFNGGVSLHLQADKWPDDIRPLRSVVHAYDEALVLADRAAALPFVGFPIGTDYARRAYDLLGLQDLSAYRAIVQASDGDSDGAVSSLVTAARLGRPLRPYAYFQRVHVFNDVEVLGHTKASPAALANLDGALEELDDDHDLDLWFQELRRRALTSPRGQYGAPKMGELVLATLFFVERPWSTHVLNSQLATFAALIAAAKEPWPQRIDRIIAVDGSALFPIRQGQNPVEGIVLGAASQTAEFRGLRIAVGIERYRRDHEGRMPASLSDLVPAYVRTIPIDPFSGKPLLMKAETDGYAVYSVGMNRKDDGAKDVNRPYVPFSPEPLADIGISLHH